MRIEILKQLNESQKNNARIENWFHILGISSRTSQRWRQGKTTDRRKGSLTVPTNKLSTTEQAVVLEIANNREFRDKSPAQIVLLLANKGFYKALESTFYPGDDFKILTSRRVVSEAARQNNPKIVV